MYCGFTVILQDYWFNVGCFADWSLHVWTLSQLCYNSEHYKLELRDPSHICCEAQAGRKPCAQLKMVWNHKEYCGLKWKTPKGQSCTLVKATSTESDAFGWPLVRWMGMTHTALYIKTQSKWLTPIIYDYHSYIASAATSQCAASIYKGSGLRIKNHF